MTTTIVNGAPLTRVLGTRDISTKQLVAEAVPVPTHLPLFFTYAKKGPTTQQMLSGSGLTNMYGEDTFDLRKKWATHATVYINQANKKANAIKIQRLKPADANPPAGVRLFMDVLPTQIDVIERNVDGSYKYDSDNKLVKTGTKVPGFKVKFIASNFTYDVDNNSDFGICGIKAGDQTDTVNSVQSQRYPIADLQCPDFGSDGNNRGLRIWAPTAQSTTPIDTRLITEQNCYPFRFAFVKRADDASTPVAVASQNGELYLDLVLKPDVIDSNTDSMVSIHDRLIQDYQAINNQDNSPDVYGPFGNMHLYDANIKTLLEQFYAAEESFIDSFSDFTGGADEEYRFNIISGMSSQNVPYQTYIVDSSASNAIRLTENSTIYATGGSDGTMSEALFGGLVIDAIAPYGDPDSEVQNIAKYPESIFYDSGFPIATKYALCKFISVRKDTALILSTHDVLGKALTVSQESSMAVALRTRAMMYPESEYYGTPTMRCMIVGCSGKLLSSQYRKRLPLSLEVLTMSADYMGASIGKWKSGKMFDTYPANAVSLFADINVTFAPAKVRNKDWSNGLVWVDNFDYRALYFPAFKTVYDNDTSVLNSYFTMMAIVELQKIGQKARRKYSGVSSLTNEQLVDRVNKYINDEVEGKFDGKYKITPNTYFTAADIARGYSWTTDIAIASPNMKTVATLSIIASRLDDEAVKI